MNYTEKLMLIKGVGQTLKRAREYLTETAEPEIVKACLHDHGCPVCDAVALLYELEYKIQEEYITAKEFEGA